MYEHMQRLLLLPLISSKPSHNKLLHLISSRKDLQLNGGLRPPKLLVTSTDARLTPDQVVEKLKATQPGQLGVQIKRLVKTPRGVLPEPGDDKQRQILETCPDIQKAGLVIKPPALKRPRVIIYDVDGTDSDTQNFNNLPEL